MLQTLVIALREGVEASLVIAIAIAYLRKAGRTDLLPTVYRAFVAAIIASFAAAFALSRIPHSDEAYEGWTLLLSAVFVLSMVVWMNRHARGLKGEIESQLQKGASSEASRWGVFLFVFLMIFREGVETVLMLGAVSLNTSGIFELIGTGVGLGLAILFGVSFVRGTIRVNIRSFFQMTTVILMVVVAQLLITGLHELSEGQILPSSSSEMALIGPIVRNDVFFFVAILSLAAAMILMEWRNRRSASMTGLEGAALRRAKWSAGRERLWMMASCVASAVFILTITAEFIYAKQSAGLSPAAPIPISGGMAHIPLAEVSDGNLHRFAIAADGATVRIIVIQRPNKTIATAFDACEICGNQGYYQKGPNVICRNCASAIFVPSIGVRGGCNPIPLESKVENGELTIPADKLFGGARLFRSASR